MFMVFQEASRIKLTHQSICLLGEGWPFEPALGHHLQKPCTGCPGRAFSCLPATPVEPCRLSGFTAGAQCVSRSFCSLHMYLACGQAASERLSKIFPGKRLAAAVRSRQPRTIMPIALSLTARSRSERRCARSGNLFEPFISPP